MTQEDYLAQLAAARQAVDRLLRDQSLIPDDAPWLHDWSIVRSGRSMCLVGGVAGHPRLDDGFIRTSELVAIGVDLDWAHTLSRFYWLLDRADGRS